MKYFNGPSGVYYDQQKNYNDLILLEEVEPYELIDKKTFKITKIKRYNIETINYKISKTALTFSDSLIYLGEL